MSRKDYCRARISKEQEIVRYYDDRYKETTNQTIRKELGRYIKAHKKKIAELFKELDSLTRRK